MSKNLKSQISNLKIKFVVFIIFVCFIYVTLKALTNSLFFTHPDRLNVLFYGQYSRYYSVGLDDGVNYFVSFPADLEIIVPGGYGKYRVGGIGKLVQLEKKPEIFKKTWSLNTASFVTRYFYPQTNEIYFGDNSSQTFSAPKAWEIILDNSNANLFDRIYLWLLFIGKGGYSFKNLNKIPINSNLDRPLFSAEDFFKQYEGYFFESSYRKENRTVQIRYTKDYLTAQFISSSLEGEGIKVVDLTANYSQQKDCSVVENSDSFSKTARSISNFFQCGLKKGKTELSDIIFTLGAIEESWSIK